MGKVRYMGKALCPIYRYWCKPGYMRALVSAAGAVAGSATGVLAALHVPAWVIVVMVPVISGLAGFGIDRLLFFSSRRDRLVDAGTGAVAGTVAMLGVLLLLASWPFTLPGVAVLAVPCVVIAAFLRAGGPIALYTDGFTIDGKVFMYDDVITTNWGCGRAVEASVPEEGKGKPIIYLTDLDYEHVEEDFGITHYYAHVVTTGAVHVMQPLRHRSDFAGNVRNAWACWDHDKRTREAAG